jgi:hypothetical protein
VTVNERGQPPEDPAGPGQRIDAMPALGPSPGGLGFRGVKFAREPRSADLYDVFISSAGDVKAARRRVRDLIHESINPPLGDISRAQLNPVMWERAAAQAVPGKTVNDLFVERVKESHATLVLFKTRLGEGTKEEIEAVLSLPELPVWLSVLRFALAADEEAYEDPRPLDEFLEDIGDSEGVLYRATGHLDSEEAWQALVRELTAFALAAFEKTRTRELTDVY